jgi:NAD(P)-dependent dehydrogenase (short-subunit alcohol dehydrogenase family)
MARKPRFSSGQRFLRALAWFSVVASFPIWGSAFLVAPFLPIPAGQRAGLAAFLIVYSEVSFWVAAFYLGADVIARYRPPKVTTGKSFAGKRVAVIGATGRLGEAVARALQREGATPLLLARDEARLRAVAATLALDESHIARVDVVVPDTLRAAAAALRAAGPIDHVVCTTGVRTSGLLAGYSDAEVVREIEVDLVGPIHVARAFLPVVEERAIIALFGSFADGNVALPYHTVEVASRSGLAGFCAATNRELELEDREPRLCYVCPAPAESSAPQLYAASFRNLGARPAPAEEVANFVLGSLLGRRTTAIMGFRAWLMSWLQGAVPWAGHALVVRAMGKALGTRPPSESEPR